MLKPVWFQRFKLQYDGLLSSFDFTDFKLRRYGKGRT